MPAPLQGGGTGSGRDSSGSAGCRRGGWGAGAPGGRDVHREPWGARAPESAGDEPGGSGADAPRGRAEPREAGALRGWAGHWSPGACRPGVRDG